MPNKIKHNEVQTMDIIHVILGMYCNLHGALRLKSVGVRHLKFKKGPNKIWMKW